MLNEQDIVEALRVCYDPEHRINVVDLGRIGGISIERDTEAPGMDTRAQVRVEVLPHNEEQDAMLVALITNRLLGMYEISRAEVSVLASPAWSPDRMTASARREVSKQRGLIQLGDAP